MKNGIIKMRVVICIVILLLLSIAAIINIFIINDPNSIIPNRRLEEVIRQQINKPVGKLTPEDCMGIKELDLSASDFNTSLEGLQYFVDLESLTSCAGSIRDISAIKELTKLKELNLDKNRIRDITPLSGLINLEGLYLYDNKVDDLTPLSTLINLKYLVIGKNPVEEKPQFYAPLSHIYGLSIGSYADYEIKIKENL